MIIMWSREPDGAALGRFGLSSRARDRPTALPKRFVTGPGKAGTSNVPGGAEGREPRVPSWPRTDPPTGIGVASPHQMAGAPFGLLDGSPASNVSCFRGASISEEERRYAPC